MELRPFTTAVPVLNHWLSLKCYLYARMTVCCHWWLLGSLWCFWKTSISPLLLVSFSYLCFAFRACFLARESTVLVPTCLLHSDFPLLRTVNHLALIQRKKHKQSVCYFLLFCTYVLACRTAACECAFSGPWESKADSKDYLKVRNVFQEADCVTGSLGCRRLSL